MDNRTPLYVLLTVVVLFVVALAVFGSGSETVAQSTTSTFADLDIPDPPLTTTTRPRAVEEVPNVIVVEVLDEPILRGLERLVVVVGQSPTGHRLLVIDDPTGEVTEIPLPAVASDFGLDASGTALSYLDADRAVRIVTTDGDPIDVPEEITQFAWSGDEPLTAAWFEPATGDTQSITLGEVVDGSLVPMTDLGPTIDFKEGLRGINSTGWWVTFEDPALPRTGLTGFRPRGEGGGWTMPADILVPPVAGTRALLARLDVSSWSWNFGLGDGRLDPLPWAPGDASGDHGLAALSPTGIQVAFIGGDDRGLGWVEIHSTVGSTARRLLLPYRVWDVGWSQRGDFVVMPGTDNAGTHVVVLVDTRLTSTQEPWVYAIEMDDWVQFATMVDSPRQTASDTGPAGE